MGFSERINYYRRIFPAYLSGGKSQLTFWHEMPRVNEQAGWDDLGQYYMPFEDKADYPGDYDSEGIPRLNYHGKIGLQYNPIAIAQYGLGNFNLYARTEDPVRRRKFLLIADWLVSHLERNRFGLWVWHHHFDWEYRTPLKAPWYSALAQGQGISLLVRAYRTTGKAIYLDSAVRAFETFLKGMEEGGVTYVDETGQVWLEEYIVSPPTHILNGFIWALWGIYDFFLVTKDAESEKLFLQAIETLKIHLGDYDAGFWSLYEQSGTRLKMMASPFYHRLHIVQLQVMARLSGEKIFRDYAERWESYHRSRWRRSLALGYKAVFKLAYY